MINQKKYIFGNWKLNKTQKETSFFFKTFNDLLKKDKKLNKNKSIIYGIAPTFILLPLANNLKINNMNIISQDVSGKQIGNYTGQINCLQLNDLKIKYSIVGHSETRKFLGVNDNIVNEKITTCLDNKINPIICIGESLVQYKTKKTKKVIINQLSTIFKNIPLSKASSCIIAYEPLWAIGSGKIPTLQEISSICCIIRDTIKKIFNFKISNNIPILYGGSVNKNNAIDIIRQNNVNGLLIGGSSLDPKHFFSIIKNISDEK